MPSSATLSTLSARVLSVLMDTSNTIWASGIITEAISLALEEYSRARPLEAVGTVTPTAATREVSVSSLTGLIDIWRVWFPYTAATPEYPPRWCDFSVFWSGGTPTLWLNSHSPSGSEVARVFYAKVHTLSGLAGAGSTTYPASDDGILVIGAAGYALLTRAADVVEVNNPVPFGTRNYDDVADRLLTQFRALLQVGGRKL